MTSSPDHLEEMPSDVLEATLKKKRFEMMTPIYGMLPVTFLLFLNVLSIAGLRYLSYVFVSLVIGFGLFHARQQRFMDWEEKFTQVYVVGDQYWLPSRMKLLHPKVTKTAIVISLVGLLISGVASYAWPDFGQVPTTTATATVADRVTPLLEKGDEAYEGEDYAAAQKNYENALEVARLEQDAMWEAIVLKSLGDVYAAQGFYPKAVSRYEMALEITGKTGERGDDAIVLFSLGVVYYEQGLDRQASEYFYEALSASDGVEDPEGRRLIHLYLSHIALNEKSYRKAITYAKKVYAACRDPECICATQMIIGQAYWGEGDAAEALQSLDEALIAAQNAGRSDWTDEIQEMIEAVSQGDEMQP